MAETPPHPRAQATEVRVLLDHKGRGEHSRALRRAFLVERNSGRILELPTAYLDHEFGLDSLNTQISVLADLAFLIAWFALKASRNANWIDPSHRAATNQVPLTQREVNDFGRWCQRSAGDMASEARSGRSNVSRLHGENVVGTKFRNRRLRNASKYLQWLVVSLATGDESNQHDIALTEVRRNLISRWFAKQVLADSKAMPPGSLDQVEADSLRKVLNNSEVFPHDDIGIRDRLIIELLLQGLRAGELLKIQVVDVNDAYRIDIGRHIGIVSIARRPNDIDDCRAHEPAVKTRPGKLPIPKRLAQALIAYVTEFRRPAVDARAGGEETPYLFVNHSGRYVGRPLSQRNLNRIVAKLKGRFGLPSNLAPHVLRHTHCTELYDDQRKKGRSDKDIRALLVDRGRWAPDSTMPARYVARSLMRESADYVEERDSELQRG